ncbi:MAG: DUF6587 family protein [Rhodanobacteraceae bacterium]
MVVTLYSIVQALIIGALVAWSVAFAARRLVPTASRRAQARIASWLELGPRAAWMRRLGHAMQPVQASSGGCGSSGCSSCGACAPVAKVEAQPLTFRSRANP